MQSGSPSQRNLPDIGVYKRLSQWLEATGFKWNPFSEIDAEHEPHLEEYFIYPVGFEEMLGENSAVLYAPRGGGKTACRRMVEHSCTVGDYIEGKVFSVTCDDFQGVVQQAKGNLESVTAQMHVEAILRNALPLLFDHLVQNPELVDGIEDLAYLRQFVKQFTDCLADYPLNQTLKRTGVTGKSITDALAHENLDWLLMDVVEDYRPQVRLVAALLEQGTAEVSLDGLTPTQLLKRFFDLVKTVGFDALFVLIDNVDGLPQTDGNPHACVTLLKPLVGTASLMSLSGVFFKFFLPLDTKPLLDRPRAFSIKQVRLVEVDWPEKLEVLRERLKAATQEGRPPITSLDVVSEGRLRGRIDGELVKYSKTPRDLVLLGREVFRAHIRQSPEKDYITVEDLDLTLKPERDKERIQQRQELWRRGLEWGGSLLAVVFALTSLLTWLLFHIPLHTTLLNVPNTSLSVFAKHPRYLPTEGDGEISVTVNNDGTAEIASIRAWLIFTPTFPIEFPKGNMAEFGPLAAGTGSTQGISFRPLEAHQIRFDLAVLTEEGTREVVEGSTIRVVPVPNALIKPFFQPLLSLVGAIVAGLSKQTSEFIFKIIVGRLKSSQPATNEDKN